MIVCTSLVATKHCTGQDCKQAPLLRQHHSKASGPQSSARSLSAAAANHEVHPELQSLNRTSAAQQEITVIITSAYPWGLSQRGRGYEGSPIIQRVIACKNSHAATRLVRSAAFSASSDTCTPRSVKPSSLSRINSMSCDPCRCGMGGEEGGFISKTVKGWTACSARHVAYTVHPVYRQAYKHQCIRPG